MVKKAAKPRPWTKAEARVLKSFAREKTQTGIARKMTWCVDAMYRLGSKLGVMLVGGRARKGA
jgi:hypothetical protein